MSELVEFLRARYTEAREREMSRRSIRPGAFGDMEVEFEYELDEPETILVGGHPYPADKFWEHAGEPAADPFVIADLDSKLALVDALAEADPHSGYITATFTAEDALRLLAKPFANHPDYKAE